jgi:hypothetical protein
MATEPKKQSAKTFVRFTGIGLQLGITIYLGGLLGEWLDNNHPVDDVSFHKICTMFAVVGGTVSVIIQVIKFGKK